MKSVVIIDDEYFFRQALKKYVSIYSDQYYIAGEADNGSDGIELIRRIHPDIVLIDITMPDGDGFYVIRNSRVERKAPKFIIISGYDYFNYAQQAIRLGVNDYLLKPVTPEKIHECLDKASTEIDSDESVNRELKTLSGIEQKNKVYLSSVLAGRLISSNVLNRETAFFADDIAFPLDAPEYSIAIIRISEYSGNLDAAVMSVYQFAAANILNDLVSKDEGISIGTSERLSWIVLVTACRKNLDLSKIYSKLKDTMGSSSRRITLCFCVCKRSAEEISTNYAFLKEKAAEYFFYFQSGVFDLSRNSSATTPNIRAEKRQTLADAYKEIYEAEKNMEMHFQSSNYSFLIRDAQTVFSCLKKSRLPVDKFYEILNLFCLKFVDLCNEYAVETSGLSIEEMKELSTIEDVENAFIYCVRNVCTQLEGTGPLTNHIMIVNVKKYILKNYSDGTLSSHSLADYFGINEQYLCYLFKKHTDITISTFIMNTRMKAAGRFLADPRNNISEVASKSGFNDAAYFSKCFKKFYGKSPKKYSVNS